MTRADRMARAAAVLKARWFDEITSADLANEAGVSGLTMQRLAAKQGLPRRTHMLGKHLGQRRPPAVDADEVLTRRRIRAATEELARRYSALAARVRRQRAAA